MVLYTCGAKKTGAPMHPCAKAAKALDDAGYEYEIEVAPGYKALFWTRWGGARDEVERLSGQKDVPILVLDSDEVVTGTGAIVDWARAHPAAAADPAE